MNVNALVEQARKAAESEALADQTADNGGNFTYEPPAKGPCFARLIGYIELGKRPQKAYMGKEKPPAREVRLVFELAGKKHAKEIEVDGEKKVIYPLITERLTIKSGDRAAFVKLLKSMDYGRGNTHMALMLGETFKLDIVHNEVEKDGKKVTYANIRDDAGWKVAAPVAMVPNPDDPEDLIEKWVKAPDTGRPMQLLLWDSPTIEQWDSIFIDGEREVKDEKGNTKVVSNNWLQEDIINNAIDFKGSALEALLASTTGGLGDLDGGKARSEAGEAEDGDLGDPGVDLPEEPEAPSTAKKSAPAASSDPLADLGIDL